MAIFDFLLLTDKADEEKIHLMSTGVHEFVSSVDTVHFLL